MFEKLKQPLAVFLLALAIRGFVCYLNFDQLSADPDAYARISETLAKTGVYGLTSADGQPTPTAFRPPLYPFLLSWLVSGDRLSRTAVAVLHSVLGAVTVLLAFLICKKLVGNRSGEWSSSLAAFLVAIDPILVQQSTLVMTETLATALATAVIWWWTQCCEHDFRRFRSSLSAVIVLGVLLALAYLCRPTFLVWSVLLGSVAVILPQRSWQRRVGVPALVLLQVAIAVFVWTERNRRVMGHPIWATTHGGYTLLLANNPSFYDYLREGSFGDVWDAQLFLTAYQHRHDGDPNTEAFWLTDWSAAERGSVTATLNRSTLSEAEDDRVCYNAARATIDREPRTFAWSCLIRLGRLWGPLPHHTAGRSWFKVTAVGVYYLLLYTAVFFGLQRAGRAVVAAPWWPIWTLAITLSVVHAIYWSNLRMRAPIMPALAAIAAIVIAPRQESECE